MEVRSVLPPDAIPSVDAPSFGVDGASWDATTGESNDGRRLERPPFRRLFAFAWRDDRGEAAFYENNALRPILRPVGTLSHHPPRDT